MNCIQAVQQYVQLGFNCLPLQLDGTKKPVGSWHHLTERRISDYEINEFWKNDQCGIGVLGGVISGNLLPLDFDKQAEPHFKRFWDDAHQAIPGIWDKMLVVKTPRPGYQVWMRTQSVPPGSQHLALGEPAPTGEHDEAGQEIWLPELLIEHRGNGYVCAVGSPPAVHKTGRPYKLIHGKFENLPQLPDQWATQLLDICRSYSLYQPDQVQQSSGEKYTGEPRPGDVYNQTADIRQLLLAAGWQHHHNDGDCEYLTRPGKAVQDGYSATLGYVRDDDDRPLLYVHSPAAVPFKKDSCYDAFGVYTTLHHRGDYSAAAVQIRTEMEPQVQAAQKQYSQKQESSTDLKVTQFSSIQPRPIQWLWHGRLALGKLTLLTGDGGVGKGMLLVDLVSRITTGRLFPDGTPSMLGTCLLVGGEDGAEDTVRPRLDAAGADVDRVLLVEGPLPSGSLMADPLDLSLHLENLDRLLGKHPDALLLVLDPIMDYLGAVTDSHKAADVRRILSPLRSLAERHNVCIILVNHLNKAAGSNSKSRSLGSGAFVQVCRIELRVTQDPKEPLRRLLLGVKNNLAWPAGLAYSIESAPNGAGRCQWEDSPVLVTIEEIEQQQHGGGQDRAQREEARDWLEVELSDGPVAATELKKRAAANGHSWRTVRRAQDELGVKPYQQERTWYWQLPDTSDGQMSTVSMP